MHNIRTFSSLDEGLSMSREMSELHRWAEITLTIPKEVKDSGRIFLYVSIYPSDRFQSVQKNYLGSEPSDITFSEFGIEIILSRHRDRTSILFVVLPHESQISRY